MKYGLIRAIDNDIIMLCDIAKVSRSGYYKWLGQIGKTERDYNDYLLIKEVFDKGRGKYGWRTIQMKLKASKGIHINHKRIIRIKRKYDLVTKIRKSNPYKNLKQQSQSHRTFKNKLDRKFNQSVPSKIFCTDIIYLPFNNRNVFLSAIKDIASREIVAWNLSPLLDMNIALNTIENMVKNKTIQTLKDTMIHSDQGLHYTNPTYIHIVRRLGMKQSMSRKGNCVGNAPMESIFGHLKDDLDYSDCKTFEELRLVTERYIDYYNNERHQWNLKKMTPVEYRNHLLTSPV